VRTALAAKPSPPADRQQQTAECVTVIQAARNRLPLAPDPAREMASWSGNASSTSVLRNGRMDAQSSPTEEIADG